MRICDHKVVTWANIEESTSSPEPLLDMYWIVHLRTPGIGLTGAVDGLDVICKMNGH